MMSYTDGVKEPLNDAFDALMKEEKLLDSAFKDMNTVFEIGLAADEPITGGILGSGGLAGIELDVGPIGEKPVQGDQNEVSK